MKKVVLFCLAWVCGSSLQAQYFQHFYGNAEPQYARDGLRTVSTGPGSVITGIYRYSDPVNGTDNGWIYSARTNQNGVIPPGAPFFNRAFRAIQPGESTVHVGDVNIVERANGDGFALASTMLTEDPVDPVLDVVFSRIDNTGTPLICVKIDVDNNPATHDYAMDIIESRDLNAAGEREYYITGTSLEVDLGRSNFFVLRITENGNLVWGYTYDISYVLQPNTRNDMAYSIVESPYGFQDQVVVVGSTTGIPDNNTDAFFCNIWKINGTNLNLDVYDRPGSESFDEFRSIKVAERPLGLAPNPNIGGFIVGGNTKRTEVINGVFKRHMDYWTLLLPPAGGNPVAQTYHDYNHTFTNCTLPNCTVRVNNSLNDIIEVYRDQNNNNLKELNEYEYYAIGTADTFNFGHKVQVLRLNNALQGINEIVYRDPNNPNDILEGMALSEDPTGFNPGILLYTSINAAANLGNTDYNKIKMPYNGMLSGNVSCRPSLLNTRTSSSNVRAQEAYAWQLSDPVAEQVQWETVDLNDQEDCTSPASMKTMPLSSSTETEANTLTLQVYPNPALAEGQDIELMYYAARDMEPLQVIWYDILGREVGQLSFISRQGKNTFTIKPGSRPWLKGTYLLKIDGESQESSRIILVH